uniref:ATP synthase F0 subunit 6 n=1 Tax=Chalcopis glandulosa TaxID=3021795 RepID=UPI0023AB22F5|nr:ATP synthase F0 subunit 6 [Chalcopis glandulosa]WCB99319.1 ATP synthase F0 subunit 6 [Chalcopis glandulosa]
MMTNLFSSFDPATSLNLSLNWTSTVLMMIIVPYPYWFLPNRLMMIFSFFNKKLHEEFKILLSNSHKGLTLMMVSLFMFIMINNLMGLMPYIFTSSSHLVFSLSLSLPLWLSMMMFGMFKNTNSLFAHMVPMGTPSILMPFMVMIESISNIIRPGSLAVRLTANMIAGHLLMSLLGNKSLEINNVILVIVITIQMLLMMFETAVSIIQAYVFSILTTLYSKEVMN